MDDDRGGTVLIASLASFLVPFAGSAITIALPDIGQDLHLNAIFLSWITTAYFLSTAAVILPCGRLADLYGRRRLFLAGLAIFTVSSLLSVVAFSGFVLVLLRIVQGVGGAVVLATSVALVTAVFPVRERGRALGITVAAMYLGLCAGPFLGGAITRAIGWRGIFLSLVPLGLLTFLVTKRHLTREWREAAGEHFDIPGAALYTGAVTVLMFGLADLPSLSALFWMVTGAGGIVAFIWFEKRALSPVLDMRIFQENPVFLLSNIAAMINYAATFAVSFLLSLFLQVVQGLDPLTAGGVLVVQPLIQMVFSPVAGRISDIIEPRIVATAGMIVTAIGLFLFTYLSPATTVPFITANLILLGIGFALFTSPNTNVIMSAVDRRFYGVASAMISTMRSIGQVISLALAMVTFTLFIGEVNLTPTIAPQFLKSIHSAFLLFTLLCTVGTLASYVHEERRRRVAHW